MAILDALKKMADKMIVREGSPVTVYFIGQSGTYDPTTGKNTPSVTLSVLSYACFLDYALESYSLTTAKGSLIERDDKEVYLKWESTYPRKPAPTDYIVDKDGVKWRIITVKEDNPSHSCVIKYTLQVRR